MACLEAKMFGEIIQSFNPFRNSQIAHIIFSAVLLCTSNITCFIYGICWCKSFDCNINVETVNGGMWKKLIRCFSNSDECIMTWKFQLGCGVESIGTSKNKKHKSFHSQDIYNLIQSIMQHRQALENVAHIEAIQKRQCTSFKCTTVRWGLLIYYWTFAFTCFEILLKCCHNIIV